jgi:hypothetical protein
MPEVVFNIVAENPEIKHVTRYMQPTGVHEHRGKQRQKITCRVIKKTLRYE